MRTDQWLAVAFWPFAVLVFFFLLHLKRRLWPARQNLFVACALILFFILSEFLFDVIGNQNAIAAFDERIYFSLAGLSLTALAWWSLRVSKKTEKKVIASLMLFFGLAISGFCGQQLVRDIAWPRRFVEGKIADMNRQLGKSGAHYFVFMDGGRYPTTADIFAQLHKGEDVRVEVGAGSGTIFRATPL